MGFLDTLLGRTRRREASIRTQREALAQVVDPVLARVRAGGALTDADLSACNTAFGAYFEALGQAHGTEDNTRFAPGHQADFYLEALKLAALGHPNHDAWPVMSGVRRHVWPALRERLASGDPWVALCAIQPALLHGDVEAARACYAKVEGDPFLAGWAVAWANDAVVGFTAYNEVAPAQAFLASVRGATPWETDAAEAPEERRWALFAAPYPYLTRDPRLRLADARPAAVVRAQLERDWDITDRDSALHIIGWLRDEGHREGLASDLEDTDAEPSARTRFVAAHRAALQQHHILAWDLGRLISTARSAHAVGFLDAAEAWDVVLHAANHLRETYPTWSAMGDDYVLGYRYFSPSVDEDNPTVATVRWLQRDPRSPWRPGPMGPRTARR